MAGTPPNLTYALDNIGTSTIEARLPGLVDALYGSNPLFQTLLAENKVTLDGGRDVRQRLIYAKKPSGWYTAFDPLGTDQKQSRTEIIFDWKQHQTHIALSGLDLIKNAGGKQISDLVHDEMDEAEMTSADDMGTELFNSGSTANKIIGLRAAIDNGDLVASYGGITRGSAAETPGLAVSGNVTTTAITFNLADMNTQFQNAVVAREKPTLIITTQAIWNLWWERSQPAQRFGEKDGNRPVRIGFPQIEFNGAAVVVDSHCPASQVYFLNTKWIKLVMHRDRMFSLSGWLFPSNQDSAINRIYLALVLMVTNPRLQNLATNVS